MRLKTCLITLALTLLAPAALAPTALAPTAMAQTANGGQLLKEKRDLAGLLGEAHYIRTLCNGANDQYWRNFMRDFLDLEGESPSRRSLFVTAFNRGYRYQSHRSTTCSQATASDEARLARKGKTLAEEIALSYLQ